VAHSGQRGSGRIIKYAHSSAFSSRLSARVTDWRAPPPQKHSLSAVCGRHRLSASQRPRANPSRARQWTLPLSTTSPARATRSRRSRLHRRCSHSHAAEERVLCLLLFDTRIETVLSASAHRLQKRLSGPAAHLIAHENADLLDLLPLTVEFEESADLEEAGCDVKPVRDATPLAQISQTRPARDAVVDDEAGLRSTKEARARQWRRSAQTRQ
jgi:hypothetical protein